MSLCGLAAVTLYFPNRINKELYTIIYPTIQPKHLHVMLQVWKNVHHCYQRQGSDCGHCGIWQWEHVSTAVPNPQVSLLQSDVLLSVQEADPDQCSFSSWGERNENVFIKLRYEVVVLRCYVVLLFWIFIDCTDHGRSVQHWTWTRANKHPSWGFDLSESCLLAGCYGNINNIVVFILPWKHIYLFCFTLI